MPADGTASVQVHIRTGSDTWMQCGLQEEKIPAARDPKTQLYLNKLHMNAADDPELIRKAYQVTI